MFVELQTLQLLTPEIILVLAASLLFVGGAFARSRALWSALAVAAYLAAAGALVFGSGDPLASVRSGPLILDPLAWAFRVVGLGLGLALTLAAQRLCDSRLATETLGAIMLASAGVMLASAANELVLLFVSLELISIPTYALLFLGRRDAASAEATMKYFFLSILSSALLLYGFSFLYGLGGTTLLAGDAATPGIREAILRAQAAGGGPFASLAPVALVLIVAGLAFKLAAAPFQFYAPDVYQGTTNVNAGLLAVAPKVVGVAALVRVLVVAFPGADYAWQLALVLSIVTMTLGNVCALWQKNVRRLLAYSSIAHGGYLLIGFTVATAAALAGPAAAAGGVSAMVVYACVYALATLGAFVALAWLGGPGREVNSIDELAGLSNPQPLAAAALAICLFSLSGIPPLAGFWGKLALFRSAIWLAGDAPSASMSLWLIVLAVAGVLNAATAAAYYLRLIALMYFYPAASPLPAAGGPGGLAAALACAAGTLLLGALPGPLFEISRQAETQIRQSSDLPGDLASEPLPAPAQMAARQAPREAGK